MAYETESEKIAKTRNLEHWVCFDCRKMFKRRARPENIASGPHRPAHPHRCPECGETMRDMGVYFEPPRKTDAIAWERMRVLAEFGLCFHTEGSRVYAKGLMGRPPARPNALRRRLISAINKSS